MKRTKKDYYKIEVPPDGQHGMVGGAYVLCFIYTPTGNVVVSGYHREVENYIKANFHKFVANIVLYRDGKARYNHWFCHNEQISIWNPTHYGRGFKNHKYVVYSRRHQTKILQFKRMPEKWIKEFNCF